MKRYCQNLCPDFQRGIALISKPWTGMILAVLVCGQLRFGELLNRLGAIGDRMLSDRLKELQAQGLIDRVVTDEHHAHIAYSLTVAGRKFESVYIALAAWGSELPKADTEVPQGNQNSLPCNSVTGKSPPRIRRRVR
jgi:DNA-binding HxlR family transcriptional regulator